MVPFLPHSILSNLAFLADAHRQGQVNYEVIMCLDASGINSREDAVREIASLAGPNFLDLELPADAGDSVVVRGRQYSTMRILTSKP